MTQDTMTEPKQRSLFALFRLPRSWPVRILLGLAVVAGICASVVLVLSILAQQLGLGVAEDFILYEWFRYSRGDTARASISCAIYSFLLAVIILFDWRKLHVLKEPLTNLALIGTTVILCLFVMEIGYRVINGTPLLPIENSIAKDRALLTTQTANDYDPDLGWVLKPEIGGSGSDPETSFTTGELGVRMNSNERKPLSKGAILAVGDSFTAGSEVGDRYSWPAQLERLLGEPVINAAVGGWASDQIILRAEQLAPILEPRIIIVSFLADDILRSGFRVYGSANKPWFDIDENGNLVRHNKPVPLFTGKPSETNASPIGYFHFLTFAIDRIGFGSWLRRGSEYIKNGNDPVAVSCKLLERAHKTFSEKNIRMLFLLQHGGDDRHDRTSQKPHADAVVACAREAGIETIDTWSPLLVEYQKGFSAYKELFVMHDNNRLYGHMSPKGNALIADLLATALKN